MAVGSVSVQEPFTWQRILFEADGTMDWFTPSERGLDAASGTNSVTELRYDALLSTAAQFNNIDDWRWLGPLSWGNSTAIALLVNDAGMIAGYGGIYTGNPTFDALRPTHAFRTPASGEFDGSAIILTNDLGVLPGGLHSFPRAMNQAGDLVGYSDFDVMNTGGLNFSQYNSHAVFWGLTNEAPDWLTNYAASYYAPHGYGDAFAINDQDQIVGASMQALGYSVGVLWQLNHNTNGVSSTTNAPFWEITDLNNRLTDPSWQVFNAVGINDDGVILAHAANAAGEKHAVLLIQTAMAVDNNRDGQVSFDLDDQTTSQNPYRFWLNDDMDVTITDWEWADPDPEVYPPTRPDSADQIINSPRDCEDLSRLWLNVPGLKDLGWPDDLYVGLKWQNITGTPSVRLFRSVEPDGGLGYIKNHLIAVQQSKYDPSQIEGDAGLCLFSIDPEGPTDGQVQPTTRPADFIFNKRDLVGQSDPSKIFLLFEGVSEGKGELQLVFLKKKSDGSWQNIGKGPSVWLNLMNIRRMYMRAYSTPLPNQFPLPWQYQTDGNPPFPYQIAADGSLTIPDENLGYGVGDSEEVPSKYAFVRPPDEENKCVVFVHGIDLSVAEQQGYAQSFFKRLWWEGYRGRFATFRWGTTLDRGAATFAPGNEGTSIYNSGAYRSWKGGASLHKYVDVLRGNMGDDAIISVAAHSLGNACTGEALRQGMQVASYVAMEAAVSMSCYNPQAPTIQKLLDAENDHPTPEFTSQLGCRAYLLNIGNNSGAKLFSYYNQDDFWLVTGHLCPTHPWVPFIGNKAVDWIDNEADNKPDAVSLNHYYYDYVTQNSLLAPRFRRPSPDGDINRIVSDPHESMAYVSRSRTGPLGAGAPGTLFDDEVNMRVLYGFSTFRPDHSGQFQRDIQLMYGRADGKQWPESFYHRLMHDLQVSP
jgi:hypothetical protein